MRSIHKSKDNHLEKKDAILLTIIQTRLDFLINNVGSEWKYPSKNDLLYIQEQINKDPHCVDLTDSKGNTTLYYVEKLRKLRWKASNNYRMNLIIQICDVVETRCLMNNLIFFLWCMKNMDYTFIFQFPATDILSNILQFSKKFSPLKTSDENFNKFHVLLKNYCDSSSADFSGFERNHVSKIKEILVDIADIVVKDSFFYSDYGIGYLLKNDLCKIQMNQNDGLEHIIQTIQHITGYTNTHFRKGAPDNLKLIFHSNFELVKHHSWIDVIYSSCHTSVAADQCKEILLNAGLITSSDIVNSALNNISLNFIKNMPIEPGYLSTWSYYLSRHFLAVHFNALSENEVADIVNYLIDMEHFSLIYHLFSNLKNKNILEIHKNGLLKRFMDKAGEEEFYPEDIGKIINLLIQAEPSCLQQLQPCDIQELRAAYEFNDFVKQVTLNELEKRPMSNAFFQPATVSETSEEGTAKDLLL